MKRFCLFILTMLFCISHAWGAYDVIHICGVAFTTDEVGTENNLVTKLNEKLGEGSATGEIYFNGGTLKFKNVRLKCKVPYGNRSFIRCEEKYLTIAASPSQSIVKCICLSLEGTNVIDVTLPLNSGLMGFADNVYLMGSGSLNATFNSEYPDNQGVTPVYGIVNTNSFSGYVEFIRTDNATNARMVGSGNASVSDNYMMIASGNPNVRYSTLSNSSIMSATLQGHTHTFSDTEGYKYLRVNSLKKTNLYVAGKQVDYTNYRDIFEDGTVQLSGKTLSFTNANIKYSSVGKPFVYYDVNDGIAEDVRTNATYSDGSTRRISNINLYGSNSVEVSAFGDSYSAFSGYSTSFSGTGSLKLSVHNTIGDSYAFDDDVSVSGTCYLSVKTSTGKVTTGRDAAAKTNVMLSSKSLYLRNTTNYFVATGNTLPVSNVTLSSATVGGLNKRYANFGYYDASTYAKPTLMLDSELLQAPGYIGKSLNVDLKAVAGKTPYYYTATGLPAGLSVDSLTGVISGTYTTADAGGKTVTIKVTDFLGNSATGTYTTPLVSEKMTFDDDDSYDFNSMVRAVEITPINCASSVSNAVSPWKYTATGLPAGVSIDATTGVISGAPTSTKDTTSTATITLTDAAGQSESIEIYVGRVFENYEFKVAGVNVTEINKDKIYDGRGLISYQPESKTLMINNTHIRYTSSSFTSFVDTEGKVETVNVTGTSEIVITTDYITSGFPNSIRITGDGDLKFVLTNMKLQPSYAVQGDVTIEDGTTATIQFQAGTSAINGTLTVPDNQVIYCSNYIASVEIPADKLTLLPQCSEKVNGSRAVKNDKELLAADGGVRFTEELEALTLYNGIPMSFSVADYVEGGIKPYTYSVTGLPTELRLSLDAATGVLSGIPFITKNVSKNVTFTVTDGIGRQVSAKCALVLKLNLGGLSYETVGGTSQTSGVTTWTDITGKAKSLEPNQLMYVDYDTETLGVTLPANVIGKDANGNWYADDIVLTDAVAYSNPYDVKAKKITYTRNFSTTVIENKAWQALFVPFAIDVTKYTDFDVAKIFTICPTKDTDGNGQLDDSDDKVMVISPVKSGKTIPNVPYLIRPKKSGSNVIVAENTTLETSDKADYVEFSTSNTEYTVNGIYNNMELKPGDNNYYMASSGNISYRQGSPATLKPNKWYMHAESIGYGHGGHAVDAETRALKFNIMVLGEDIDEAPSFDEVNGNVGIFTINGVRLNSLDNAPTGIYIVNGKKVIKTNK